jgi:hypothetical protein
LSALVDTICIVCCSCLYRRSGSEYNGAEQYTEPASSESERERGGRKEGKGGRGGGGGGGGQR